MSPDPKTGRVRKCGPESGSLCQISQESGSISDLLGRFFGGKLMSGCYDHLAIRSKASKIQAPKIQAKNLNSN